MTDNHILLMRRLSTGWLFESRLSDFTGPTAHVSHVSHVKPLAKR